MIEKKTKSPRLSVLRIANLNFNQIKKSKMTGFTTFLKVVGTNVALISYQRSECTSELRQLSMRSLATRGLDTGIWAFDVADDSHASARSEYDLYSMTSDEAIGDLSLVITVCR